MTVDLQYLEIAELTSRIRTGDISPVPVMREQLDRIAARDASVRE
jgi:Asp-tRNA(Asn)/Glu-tRNA(Gln) amidotransferase A subunit family amidase